jgi:hypothetical protein
MSTYSEKLRDPRWQKMRLKVLERDGWACQRCGREDITLNVHHRDYAVGRDPWDYMDCLLVTLCEDCHKHETDELNSAIECLSNTARLNLLSDDIRTVSRFIAAIASSDVSMETIVEYCEWRGLKSIADEYSTALQFLPATPAT